MSTVIGTPSVHARLERLCTIRAFAPHALLRHTRVCTMRAFAPHTPFHGAPPVHNAHMAMHL